MTSGAYLELAANRASFDAAPHRQPEAFGLDFRAWVSPLSLHAHRPNGIAVVLQDWASSDGLNRSDLSVLQSHGRDPARTTNRRLDELLDDIFGLEFSDIYATNAFPFVKGGTMSARLRLSEVRETVLRFTIEELKLAAPRVVLALGSVAYRALAAEGVTCMALPHPAARMGLARHKAAWIDALRKAAVPMPWDPKRYEPTDA